MNDNPFSTTAGPSDAPSVSAAATDLRNAASGFVKSTEAQAALLRDRALETAQVFKDVATDRAQQFKATATEKAEHFKAVTTEKAEHYKQVVTEKAHDARENAQHQWDETRVKAKELHVTAEDYIRQNPTKSVLYAVGLGFLIGVITRR